MAEEKSARPKKAGALVLGKRFELPADPLPVCAIRTQIQCRLVGGSCFRRVLASSFQIADAFQDVRVLRIRLRRPAKLLDRLRAVSGLSQ